MPERRNSMVSNAQSESSRSDTGARGAALKKGGGEGSMDERGLSMMHVQQQAKNYYKQVSEHKEITKLLSLMSTSINSTKKVPKKSIN